MDAFLYFFKSAAVSHLARVARKCGNDIWGFLTLADVLNLSVTSRDSAGLVISVENIQRLLEKNSRVRSIGQYTLSFASDVSLGILRRMLHRVVSSTQCVLSIEGSTGRIIMDIGSAFKDRDSLMASMVTAVPCTEDDLNLPPGVYGEEPILKAIEHASFDEYDDYTPRHPSMKTHRRGGSYFNSDIGEYGNEALQGMSSGRPATNVAALAALAQLGDSIGDLSLGDSQVPFSQYTERAEKLAKLREQVSGTRVDVNTA